MSESADAIEADDDELRAADYAEDLAEARHDEPGDDHTACDRYEDGLERGWGDAR